MTTSNDCGGKLAIKEYGNWQKLLETPHKGMYISCRQLPKRMVD